ncbi:MAG: hypothetical protein EXR29_00695 [Betaproteobacteria bacterium]|nr:hypothetical protein [Betaproteobacteria bacterium]
MTQIDEPPRGTQQAALNAAPQDYVRFDTEADFQAAVDRLLIQKGRELRVFDPDLAVFKLNSPGRVESLRSFLASSRTCRLYFVLHNPEPLTRTCPRMMNLLALYNHAIQINRTSEQIRELQDSFILLDRNHYVRRPVARFFRGAAGINDETEALVMRSRFQEIWDASYPAASSTTAGL